VSLAEYQSQNLCASSDPITGNVTAVSLFPALQPTGFDQTCATALSGGAPYGPRIDMLGQLASGAPVSYHWADPISQTPTLNTVQEWDVYNFTPDSHPIHVHGTRFQIIGRDSLVVDPATGKAAIPATLAAAGSYTALPTEAGYKDTLDALPGQRLRMLANFTRPGLYQWHCHITEHEDNEMMLPMCVVPAGTAPTACAVPANATKGNAVPPAVPISPMMAKIMSFAVTPAGNLPSTVMRIFLALDWISVWVASTCSTSEVPMPCANAPNAPWVEVWLSPHTIVVPGNVKPCSGPMMWTTP
jgi:hypothetical protein